MGYHAPDFYAATNFKDFDPDMINWHNQSGNIALDYFKYFNIWWNKDRFNYANSDQLAHMCSEYFNIWWDPNRFNWIHGSPFLASCCKDYFNIWFNCRQRELFFPKKFLPQYCFAHFDKWWKPKRFVYSEHAVKYLILKCSKHFPKWYQKGIFNQITLNNFSFQYDTESADYFQEKNIDLYANYSLKTLLDMFCKEYENLWNKDFVLSELKES